MTLLTDEALQGYQADGANPYLYSSAHWFAFEAGRALQMTGRLPPVKVWMGRGYTVNLHTAATEFRARWDTRNTCILERNDQ